MEQLIRELTVLQIMLMRQRRDHNGQVLDRDDIDQIQIVIDIINNLIIDDKYIWRKPKN
jgi:hypothetical protein